MIRAEATCVHCGKKIEYRDGYYGRSAYARMNWFERGVGYQPKPEAENHYECLASKTAHKPREVCDYIRGDGARCLKKIKPQDIAAGLLACGVHMRKEIEAQDAIKARAEYEEREAEQQALRDWEASVFQSLADRLSAALPDVPFRYTTDSGYSTSDSVVERSSYGTPKVIRVRKHVIVEMQALVDALEARRDR